VAVGFFDPTKIAHNFLNLFTPDMLHGIEVMGFSDPLNNPGIFILSFLAM
jgi:hypothetical protein